ncbi:hypothetical protein [Aliiroseovarius subalbicans]|uniref:hypothetical protein n=1 Tax=Aliiroseovarius subalbicans TaxID=2925840 RepID=UPI001F5AD709|nr:hypothetical protein [Aliiroseovarius subalbicans]MCI2398513.1 hypothetical protein [Aliiroseovarius subalbicans]
MSAGAIPRRDPARVMRLHRLGSLHQCRLSFMRQLTRRMARENWTFSRPVFNIDAHGVGHAVYSAKGPDRTYSLVAFAHDLPADQRSDRVIAQAWDATFTLFDGVPDADDIARLRANVPLQEAGRVTAREISVSRANRSVRLWAHFVEALAAGHQPDPARIDEVGYLMRTTAVYGSGKLGAADREALAGREETQAPFQVEMLSVFLTRAFVRDLVEHMARARGGDAAVRLDPTLARQLGIGNSTGLGMAPYLVNHPVLFNNWIMAREEAIARVRSLPTATAKAVAQVRGLLAEMRAQAQTDPSQHPIQIERNAALAADLSALLAEMEARDMAGDQPWNRLFLWAEQTLSDEGQECLASFMLEPYGDLVDGLGACMADANADAARIDGAMPVATLLDLLQGTYGWALALDWQAHEAQARAWYVSEEKLEPRLGERFDEPIAAYEQPLAPGRDAAALAQALAGWDGTTPVAAFLLKHPEHRHMVRRVQISAHAPYGEIRDNTISAEVLPIDMLRCKLSFFGATRFDPRSDRWVRICMYAGAPYPDGLTDDNADLWVYDQTEAPA